MKGSECSGANYSQKKLGEEANPLDVDEQFVEAVRSRANEALGTWGQSL